jgi:hypothetical protein
MKLKPPTMLNKNKVVSPKLNPSPNKDIVLARSLYNMVTRFGYTTDRARTILGLKP